MGLSTACYISAAWNLLQSGCEALNAWVPGLSPGVLSSRVTLPNLDSNTRRIEKLASLIHLPASEIKEEFENKPLSKSVRVIAEDSGHMACAHGNLACGIIGLSPRLIGHQNEDVRFYRDKHIIQRCTDEKLRFDDLIEKSPDEADALIAFLAKKISPAEIEKFQQHLQFLEMDLNDSELSFIINHEMGHLTYQDPKQAFQLSSVVRFSGVFAAEWLASACVPQLSLAYYASQLAGYLLSRFAVASVVRHRQELRADEFAANDKQQAVGGVRLFKRLLILEWLGSKPNPAGLEEKSSEGQTPLMTKLRRFEAGLSHPATKARLAACAKHLSR